MMSEWLGGVKGERRINERERPLFFSHSLFSPTLPPSGPDALSETLLDGLRQSRRAVVELEAVSQVVGALLDREKRQFERIQFVLKKVGNDAAFAKSIAKVRAAEKDELRRYKQKYGELVE